MFLKTKPLEGYFNALDGLRALAILLVILNHFVIPLPEALEFFRARGHLGVEIFFAVSGFLVMRSYHICFQRNLGQGAKTLKEFFIRRGLRIFFPFYLALFVIIAMAFVVPSLEEKLKSIQNIWLSIPFYFYNYAKPLASGDVPGVLNIMWSLAFEEQFYILLGLICVLFKKNLGRNLIGLAIISIFFRFLTVTLDPSIGFQRLQFETHMRLDAILFGCIGYIYFAPLTDFLKRRKVFQWGVYLGAFVAFLYGANTAAPMSTALSLTLTSVFFSALVLVIMASPNQITSKTLAWPPLVQAGKTSYEVYLIHQILNAGLVKLGVQSHPVLYGLTLMGGSFFSAWIWYAYINKPVQHYLKQKILG